MFQGQSNMIIPSTSEFQRKIKDIQRDSWLGKEVKVISAAREIMT